MIEEDFHNHICNYLQNNFGYRRLSAGDMQDMEYHFIEGQLFEFIQHTQSESWQYLSDNYFGSGTGRQIIKTIREDLRIKPLWLIMRDGIEIKDKRIYLYIPRPRSRNSSRQAAAFNANIFAFKKEFYFSQADAEAIDLVLYLNGLPVATAELKHHGAEGEAKTYIDAINQYVERRQENSRIFTVPFAHFAADTDEVWVATNPADADCFQPFNAGLSNNENPEIPEGEYPVWHLYGQAFSPDYISDFIEYFLLFVPANETSPEPAFTIFPRFHQMRSTRNLTADLLLHADENDILGKRYLINHSPGSGKTLTISWMAERIDSLHTTTTNNKVVDLVFILTDRKSLDTNVKDDLKKFTHLKHKIVFTDKANEVTAHIHKRTNIIVTTIQKFNYVQKELASDESLQNLKVAFLIDEAHRSQSGKMGRRLRNTFTTAVNVNSDVEEQEEEITIEDEIEVAFRSLDISRQVFVAFTATPVDKTFKLFGKPFDVYTEEEAISEDYILDVADNIISYSTLYHLATTWSKPDNRLYPQGILANLLRTKAYEDELIIQYKAAVIVEHFTKEIMPLISGKAKAMVVTSSRQAGYNYFVALNNIIKEKSLPFKILYAFTDFTEKISKQPLTEANVNHLPITDEMPIETWFSKDEYRIMVVASKFQQGFDEPLLSAMYLDKFVKGVNAVQTISRLNRKCPGKLSTAVIDFTNNAKEIFKAFSKYRKGVKIRETEPDPRELSDLYEEIMGYGVFNQEMIDAYIQAARKQDDPLFAALTLAYRNNFNKTIPDFEIRKFFVNLLHKYIRLYNFLAQFFEISKHLEEFAFFSGLIAGKLIKIGSESSLKKALNDITVEKASIKYLGNKVNPKAFGEATPPRNQTPVAPPKVTIEEVLDNIRQRYNIREGDEIIIKEIYVSTMNDKEITDLIFGNLGNRSFLEQVVVRRIREMIIKTYREQGHIRKTREPLYKDPGGIFDLLAMNILRHAVQKATYS